MEKISETLTKQITVKECQKGSLKPKCEYCGKEFEFARYSDILEKWHHEDCGCDQEIEHFKKLREKENINYVKRNKNFILRKIGVGNIYFDKCFENFKANTKAKQHALNESVKFVENIISGNKTKGLFYIGKPGTGKTHLCASIIQKLIEEKPQYFFEGSYSYVKLVNVIDLLDEIKSTYNEHSTNSEKDVINYYSTIELLILDDFGKTYAKKESNDTTWSDEKLYKIINNRYENLETTIVTTNFSIKNLESKMDSAIISRLFEMCNGLLCNWEDYRKNN